MRLVAYEDNPWATVQGEGVLLGTPSVFLRLYGCDYSCSWCDTKKSWDPQEHPQLMFLDDILARMRRFHFTHAVLTGGNPLLQAEELADLIVALKETYHDGETWRQGMHVTVETQASIFDEAVARHVDLLSLSPKLHDWRAEVIIDYMRASMKIGNDVQLKIVCGGDTDDLSVKTAVERLAALHSIGSALNPGWTKRNLHLILQPEGSLSRMGVKQVTSYLHEWYEKAEGAQLLPVIRVIPQTHKGIGLYAR